MMRGIVLECFGQDSNLRTPTGAGLEPAAFDQTRQPKHERIQPYESRLLKPYFLTLIPQLGQPQYQVHHRLQPLLHLLYDAEQKHQ